MIRIQIVAILLLLIAWSCIREKGYEEVVFFDDFSDYPFGGISSPVGAHTEYHYLAEAQLNPVWKVTSFYHNPRGADTAWRIRDFKGRKALFQSITNPLNFTHPMVVAQGNTWQDYAVEAEMTPAQTGARAGIIFRYKNDRQYYFFGMEKEKLVLLTVNHDTAFHAPNESVLAEKERAWKTDETCLLKVELRKEKIHAFLNGESIFTVGDTLYHQGKIALVADKPCWFHRVEVKTTPEEFERSKQEKEAVLSEEKKLQDSNPKPVLWKKISTAGFGVGRNLRFGDLNNDGQTDVLIGQVVHHAYPRDSYSELSCLTAMTFDGMKLWQVGTPSPDHETLTNDVAFQIFDLDHNGRNEVIYTMGCELIVADGATGKILFKRPTPDFHTIQYATDSKNVVREWDKILGDCLFFCDLRGKGYPQDIVIKDRYTKFWVLDEKLRVQWSAECRTGHFPYSKDMDGDGREELFIGYSCFNWKGDVIWSLDHDLKDHCDGVGVADFKGNGDLEVFVAASDQGAIVLDKSGQIKRSHLVGHVQNPAIANFRDDLPGLETVSVNFWGSQGIIHFYDSNQQIYHSFEPTQYGSMCLPVNWNGSSEELFVLNANVSEGGMYNGRGQRVVLFPDDGHPDMCNAVLNMTGDLRDEIVVWDPREIWVYTQSDPPKSGNLHPTKRNPLYNYSNYQLTVSEPVVSN